LAEDGIESVNAFVGTGITTKLEEIMNPYDLIDVVVGGEKVQARPTAWSGELENLTPIRYQTTCPKCSQLVEFQATVASQVRCLTCDPEPQELSKKSEVVEEVAPIDSGTIVDPLTNGSFPSEMIDMGFMDKCKA